MKLRIGYLGIGAISTTSPLPECQKDVERTADLYRYAGQVTTVLAAPVVPLEAIVVEKDLLYGEDLAVIHYSGHGMLGPKKKKWFLWLGDSTHCVELGEFVDKVVVPVVPRVKNVLLVLDSCFSGKAARRAAKKSDQIVPGKLLSGVKTIGDLDDSALGGTDVTEHTTLKSLPTVAVVAACTARQYAYGAFSSYANNGVGTLDTAGMSHFSYHFCNHLFRAYERYTGHKPWKEEVNPEAEFQHFTRTVRTCMTAQLKSEDTAQWRNSPPKSFYPRLTARRGRKFNLPFVQRNNWWS